jgi:O-antigen/teichoic acid export membrane protein
MSWETCLRTEFQSCESQDGEMRVSEVRMREPVPVDLSPEEELVLSEAATQSFKFEIGNISRQSGIVFAGTIFTACLGYIFKIYLARVLGAENLGLYALGMTIVSFFGLINAFGLPDSATRFVAVYSVSKRVEALRALLWNGSWMLLAANLIFAALLVKVGPWFVGRFYHAPQLARYLPLFAVIMITGALNSFLGKVLAGYKEVGRRTLVTRFLASPVTMLIAIASISAGYALWGYLFAQIAGAVIVMALLAFLVRRLTPAAARTPDLTKLWIGSEVWLFSAASFGIGLMEFLTSQSDRVALGFYRRPYDVGVYAVAAALVAYESIVLQSVNQIFAPVIAEVHARGELVLLGRLFQTLTKWMLALTLPLAIWMLAYAHPIMRIFGREFESGWPILIIGTCGQLVNCGVGSVGCLLFMSGNQHRLMRVQAVMAVLMVLLCIVFVPRWGAIGAALAAAITTAGTNALNLLEVHGALRVSPYNRSYLKLLPATASVLFVIMLLRKASLLINSDRVVLFAALLLSYVVFLATTRVLGLDADDRLITGAVWARIRPAFQE